MARDRQPWLRLYVDILDNPKAQRLRGDTFKGWINLLALTKRNGGVLPGVGDIAFALRTTEAKATRLIDELIVAGLVDETEESGAQPHDWDELQFESDSSTERVRKHREGKSKRPRNEQRNADVTLHGTPPETEADTEQSRAEAETAAPDFIRIGNAAIEAAGLDPARYVGSFAVVQGWLGQGHREETILAAIRERASRPGYEPKGLDYWTPVIADFAKRRNNGTMVGEASKPADPATTREPTAAELEAFKAAGVSPYPLRRGASLPRHIYNAAVTNGWIPPELRRASA